MKSVRLQESMYAFVLEAGEPVIDSIKAYAKEHKLLGGRLSGIGAFEEVTLGFYDPEEKRFHEVRIREQVECVSLTGNLAFTYAEPKVHAHVVVSKKDGSAWGGHLIEAKVRPNLEIMLMELPGGLQRTIDAETGLAVLEI